MPEMSLRQYARHRGVTHQAVRRAIERGAVTPLRREGQRVIIDSEAADRQWTENTDQTRRPVSTEAVPGNETSRAYASARAIREQYEARLARLNFEEKSGKLVNADEVKVAAFNSARTARDALRGIADRVAPMIAGMTDTRAIHRILSEEAERICVALSGEEAAR